VTGSFVNNLSDSIESLEIIGCELTISELKLKDKNWKMLRTLVLDWNEYSLEVEDVQEIFDYICQHFINLEHICFNNDMIHSDVDYSEIKRLKKLKCWTTPFTTRNFDKLIQMVWNCETDEPSIKVICPCIQKHEEYCESVWWKKVPVAQEV